MTKVLNQATAPITLVDKSGKGHTIRPGEEASVSFDANNEHNRQMFAMGAVVEATGDHPSSSNKGASKRSSKAAPRSRSKAAAKKAAAAAEPASDTSASEA